MYRTLRTFLETQVDNSPLILFRMIFGFLIAAESFGAILTGWVHETFIEPKFTFTMIGFEWLEPLPGDGMIYYFIIMGTAALLMMLGLFYRISSFVFLVMWTVVYMMQKSHYNNHYYLLILLSAIMLLLPAHKGKSLDVKWGLTTSSDSCARICHWIFIIQIMIVYIYASINKMHWDWIEAKPIGIWFQHKSNYWLIGPLLTERWFQYAIAWGGILYDGSIVFLLLYSKTRKYGFVLSIFFNLFNSAVFQIGIFPYLMITLTIFFFPPDTIRKVFFRRKQKVAFIQKKLSPGWTWALVIYFLIQITLPLRPHFYEGNVNSSGEGHRLSWRMMLRTKSGIIKIETLNKTSRERKTIEINDYITPNQYSSFSSHPDMIWQLAQRIKKEHLQKGEEIAVHVDAKISLNGRSYTHLIDPSVDMASVPWERWKHSDWILTSEIDD